jgi:hypothetical protein
MRKTPLDFETIGSFMNEMAARLIRSTISLPGSGDFHLVSMVYGTSPVTGTERR